MKNFGPKKFKIAKIGDPLGGCHGVHRAFLRDQQVINWGSTGDQQGQAFFSQTPVVEAPHGNRRHRGGAAAPQVLLNLNRVIV